MRARTPAGLDREMWALLTAYQVLRTAMTDATDSRPGIDARSPNIDRTTYKATVTIAMLTAAT